MCPVLRSLHMKLVMIMVLLILSLMMVIGAFLTNSVIAFYLNEFYAQVNDVFSDVEIINALRTETNDEEDGTEMIFQVLDAYSGTLGINSSSRNFYILDGRTGGFLAGTDDVQWETMDYSPNLLTALNEGVVGDASSAVTGYMDVAIPIERGGIPYIIYIRDNKTTVTNLTSEIIVLVIQALVFGLVISVLLSFLLSKTMVTPIRRLTEGAKRVADGDFTRKISVSSQDEIGVLTENFNTMAGQLQDTIRQAENERNKLNTLFLHMTDGVVAFSHLGRIIHVNPAASEMLQRTIGGETTYDELFGEIAPLESALQTEDRLEANLSVSNRHLELFLAPFDRQNQGGGVLAVIHDVTQQHRNEEMRREFVANVSHELRTPLTNIHSYAETLVDGQGDIPEKTEKKFLNVILSESERMTSIVQDLLTLSRFDSGRNDMNLSRFSFASAVNDVYQAFYMDAQRHDHTLTLSLSPDLPHIIGDRERIVQVMTNIVSNAVKYTPDGGAIAVTAEKCGDMVRLVVDDNGIGIPKEDRPRIFERFYRVDKARSRQSGGTGLGLSIALEIINRHEGTLAILDKDTPGLAVCMELKIEGPAHEA